LTAQFEVFKFFARLSMTASESQRKIGVFSHAGTKNLGDEALLAAVIQNIRARIPNAELTGFTINPQDTHPRHGIPAFPIRRLDRPSTGFVSAESSLPAAPSFSAPLQTPTSAPSRWKQSMKAVPGLAAALRGFRNFLGAVKGAALEPKFLLDSYRRLRGVELLLVAGSQQLNDIYGAWGFPITLFKWMLLARLTGTKVAILSVGAGPISSPFSRFLIRRVLRMCSYRSYRDAISSKLVESIGVDGPNPVFPDLVYSLQLPSPRPVPKVAESIVVGVNPVPFYDVRYWATPNAARYHDYVQKFARFAEWLHQNGYSTLFFPTQARADILTIQDIRAELNGKTNSKRMIAGIPIQNLDDLISEIQRADLVVANRYHGILLSLLLNKPVLGIAYHEKSRALLEQAGQGDYVLNIADFSTEGLIEKIMALHANSARAKKEIASRIAPLREALELQYDAVFSLIGIPPSRPLGN